MPYNNRFKIPNTIWNLAKKQALASIVSYININRLITYSELSEGISVLELGPHDQRLWDICGDLSKESTKKYKFMISAWVVRTESQQPGGMYSEQGFTAWAKELGYKIDINEDKFWYGQILLIRKHYNLSNKKVVI